MPLELTEIVLEGVGPFWSTRHIPLGPGAIVISAPNESGKSILLRLVSLLLDPSDDLPGMVGLRSKPSAERSRAAIALTRGGTSYRVGLDLVDGSYRLSQDASLDDLWKTAPVSTAYLRDKLALPPPGLFGTLFLSTRARLASFSALAESAPAMDQETAELHLRAAREKLDQLRDELAGEGVSSPYEQALIQLENTEQRLTDGRKIGAELEDLEKQLLPFAPLERKLSSELEQQAAAYPQRRRKHEERVRAGEQALAELQRRKRTLFLPPPLIWGWATAVVGFGGLATWANRAALEMARILFAGVGVLLGWALLASLALLGRAVLLAHRQAKLERAKATEEQSYDDETSAVAELATHLELGAPGKLVAVIDRLKKLHRRREELRERLAGIGRLDELEREITRLCEKLAESERQRPEGVEPSSGARLAAAERALLEAEAMRERTVSAEREGSVSALGLRVEELLCRAGVLCGRTPEAVWDDALELVGAYLQALTNRHYTDVSREGEGLYYLEREGVAPTALYEVSETVLQLFHHALQFAVVERAALHTSVPLLLDDPFVGLDPERRQGAARAVRRLGAGIQVLFATAEPAFEEAADLVVKF